MKFTKATLGAVAVSAALGLGTALPAQAGSVFLTGHDTLLHDGAEGFDTVILDFLRGAGTMSEIARANYSIAVLGSNVGNWGWSDVPGFNDRGTKPGFESTTFFLVDTLDAAGWASALTRDVIVVLDHTSCGGCDLSTAGSNAINAMAGAIAVAFNAGMDIYGGSGANLGTFYNFLPPGAATSGPPISGNSGFVATAAGVAIGLTPAMINGDPTHNRFTGFDPDFTIFETRANTSLPGGQEIISIGIRDASIVDGGIGTCGTPGLPDCPTVPEPGALSLLALGAFGLGWALRRRTR